MLRVTTGLMRSLPILLTGLSIIFAMPIDAATAAGTFEITSKIAAPETPMGAALGRMTLEKAFSGGMEGTSTVEMLASMTAIKGSATYVALEQFKGKLDGHTGTFVLQHRGVAKGESQTLDVSVVQDSGTGELTGISGKFDIRIEGGKHFYTFTYSLPK